MKANYRSLLIAAIVLAVPSVSFAEAPAYKADISFGKDDIKTDPICIAVDAADRVFVLLDGNKVLEYDTAGKKTGEFKADMKPAATTMAVTDGRIHLFTGLKEMKEIEFRGKKVKRLVPVGVGCVVYDPKGARISDFKLPEASSAADAHFIGKELALGDLDKKQVLFYEINGTEAKVTRKITKGFRLCCGIFDFCPGSGDTLIAANLGAFKVQAFKDAGKTWEFGSRGEKTEEFRGCCNPVNVATLADDSLVTVEKDPTRVKIFDKEHKTCARITGLTELVKGCSTIPVAVDSKGAVYLASSTKNCVVKCVPGISDKPEPPEPKEEEMQDEELSLTDKFVMKTLLPLMEENQYDKARAAVENHLKTNPELAVDLKCELKMMVNVMPLVDKNDADGAIKALEAVAKEYPDSEFAKNIEETKEEIRQAIESGQQTEDDDEESGEAPEE